jgi:CheY-like chemotaxis protein
MHANSSKRILLVEDNENDAELTSGVLARNGTPIQLDVVRDGEEALDYLFRRGDYASRPPGEPVVIFLDIKMPKVSGTEVLRDLKSASSAEAIRTIPVVILTSSREGEDLRECYRLGANGYVVKPVDATQFTQAIRSLATFWAATNEPPPH